MDLSRVETFLALTEELHFDRTAERLRFAQSKVSRPAADSIAVPGASPTPMVPSP